MIRFTRPFLTKEAVLSAHEEQLFRSMAAIYATTGQFSTVMTATTRAQRRLADDVRVMVEAEGWIA